MARSIFKSCFCLMLVLVWVQGLSADDATPVPRIEVKDDFSKKPQAPWQSSGRVDWKPKELTLQAGGAITLPKELGFDCELTLNLVFPELDKDEKVAETRISFVEESQDTSVVFKREQTADGLVATVITETGATGLLQRRKSQTVREFVLKRDLESGTYRLRFREKLVTVEGPAEFQSRAYAKDGIDDEPRFIQIRQISGAIRLSSFSINSSLPAEIPGTLEALKQTQLMTQLSGQAEKEQLAGRLLDAAKKREQVLNLSRQLFGENSTTVALSYLGYAEAAVATRNYAEAERRYKQAIEAHERTYGPEHPQTAICCYLAASVCSKRGLWIDALGLNQRALKMMEAVYGPDSPELPQYLNNTALHLGKLGQERHARGLLERALTINERVKGVTSFEAALAHNNLAGTLRRLNMLREAEQHYKRAIEIARTNDLSDRPVLPSAISGLAVLYLDLERLGEAEELLVEALKLTTDSKSASEDIIDVRVNLASLRQRQGRIAEAEALLKQSIEERKERLGPAHPEVAFATGNLAAVYVDMGRYSEAVQTNRIALRLYQASLGHRSSEAARIQSSLAATLVVLGELTEAEVLVRDAAATRRLLYGDFSPDYSSSLLHLAEILASQRRYAEALRVAREALTVREVASGPSSRETRTARHNVGTILVMSRNHTEALATFVKNQELESESPTVDPGDQAATLASIGHCQLAMGRLEAARKTLESARDAIAKISRQDRMPDTYLLGNLGQVYRRLGMTAQAEEAIQTSVDDARKRFGNRNIQVAMQLHNLAFLHHQQKHLADAEKSWKEAYGIFNQLREDVGSKGIERAHWSGMLGLLDDYIALLAEIGKSEEAWEINESILSRGFADELAVRAAATRPERLKEQELDSRIRAIEHQVRILTASGADRVRQEELGAEQLQLSSERLRLRGEITQRIGHGVGKAQTLVGIQTQLPPATAFVRWLDTTPAWVVIVANTGAPRWLQLQKQPDGEGDDSQPAQTQLRNWLARGAERADLVPPAKVLEHLQSTFWNPVEVFLREKEIRHLIILPSKPLRGIPIEVLAGDRYTVSYAPSASAIAQLRGDRKGGDDSANASGLLAVGDPDFKSQAMKELPEPPESGVFAVAIVPESPAEKAGIRIGDVLLEYGDTKLAGPDALIPAILKHLPEQKPVSVEIWRAGETIRLTIPVIPPGKKLGVSFNTRSTAAVEVRDRRLLASTFRGVGGESEQLVSLPGTRAEVHAIAQLFESDSSLILLGSDASEQRLVAIAESGQLSRFRFLHFATHGFADGRSPWRSRISLARDAIPDPQEQFLNGRRVFTGDLTARTILEEWKINADLVVLSACQSGLGEYVDGEGYLGFAQALLLSGARSVVLSLWNVDDTATSLLMTRFYQNLLGKRDGLDGPLSKAESLREAKLWIRNLTRAEVFKTIKEIGLDGREFPSGEKPFASPQFWAAFILIGDAG